MNHCCSAAGYDARDSHKRSCPACGAECLDVSTRTIAHHITDSWHWTPCSEHHYFCDNPGCDTVYFSDDGSVVSKTMLRTRGGVKERDVDSLLCHCFGVSWADFEREPSVREFVVEQTKAGRCSCETSNPSGRCCLKDFPRPRD